LRSTVYEAVKRFKSNRKSCLVIAGLAHSSATSVLTGRACLNTCIRQYDERKACGYIVVKNVVVNFYKLTRERVEYARGRFLQHAVEGDATEFMVKVKNRSKLKRRSAIFSVR